MPLHEPKKQLARPLRDHFPHKHVVWCGVRRRHNLELLAMLLLLLLPLLEQLLLVASSHAIASATIACPIANAHGLAARSPAPYRRTVQSSSSASPAKSFPSASLRLVLACSAVFAKMAIICWK